MTSVFVAAMTGRRATGEIVFLYAHQDLAACPWHEVSDGDTCMLITDIEFLWSSP